MLYLEITGRDVRCYLHHSPGSASVWSYEEVVAGKADGELSNLFSDGDIAELKAEAAKRVPTRPR
jgi:hypothetical protein